MLKGMLILPNYQNMSSKSTSIKTTNVRKCSEFICNNDGLELISFKDFLDARFDQVIRLVFCTISTLCEHKAI